MFTFHSQLNLVANSYAFGGEKARVPLRIQIIKRIPNLITFLSRKPQSDKNLRKHLYYETQYFLKGFDSEEHLESKCQCVDKYSQNVTVRIFECFAMSEKEFPHFKLNSCVSMAKDKYINRTMDVETANEKNVRQRFGRALERQ